MVPVGATNRCQCPGYIRKHLAVSTKSITSSPDAPAPPRRRRPTPLLHLAVAAATDAVRLLDVALAAATDAVRLLNVVAAAADALCPDDGVDPRAPAGPDAPPTVPRRPL